MKAEYSTRARVLILEFLKENTAHVTASDIIEHLKKQNIKIGVATVYRTLDKFVSDGIVRKMTIDERSGACYQYIHSAECASHFHLKCIKCGSLFHLSCDFLKNMEKHILDEHGFTVSSGKTVIYGLCKSCSDKE
jgi:Fur family ferric uptake transcriptional regulator